MAFWGKPQKCVDLAKTRNFFVQTTMFYDFDQVFSEKIPKTMTFCEKPQKRVDLAKPRNFFVQTAMY